jgi:hypothetical protein
LFNYMAIKLIRINDLESEVVKVPRIRNGAITKRRPSPSALRASPPRDVTVITAKLISNMANHVLRGGKQRVDSRNGRARTVG